MTKKILAGIEFITVIGSPRRYVGSSKDVDDRNRHHHSDLRANRHKNARLQRAWNKLGDQAESLFVFDVLERFELPDDDMEARAFLIDREQTWFDKLEIDIKKDFNLAPVAGSNLGFRHSEETKSLFSQQRKGRPWTEAQRASQPSRKGRPSPNKGHKASPETIARMSESHKGNTGRLGQPLSEEHRAKIGATQVGKILSSETRTRMSEAKKESWRKAKESGIPYRPTRTKEDMSEEERLNRSNGVKASWERRRLNENPDTQSPN